MNRKRHSPGGSLCAAGMLFYFLAFLLPAVRDASMTGYILAVAVPCLIFLGSYMLPHLVPVDRLLMTLTNLFCAMGVLLRFSMSPSLAIRQAVCFGIGILVMVCSAAMMQRVRPGAGFLLPAAAISLLLTGLPLLGKNSVGLPGWMELGQSSLQPGELGKPLLIPVLAGLLSRRRLLPALGFCAALLSLLLLQRDLCGALILGGTAVLLFWGATGNWILLILGLAAETALAGAGGLLLPSFRLSFLVPPVSPADTESAALPLQNCFQLVSSGGLWGAGLGLSSPQEIPSGQSEFSFALLCHSFGFIAGVCFLMLYAALLWRGSSAARTARRSFPGLGAMGAVILIGLQTFAAVSSTLQLLPLTGAALPFISSNETSLIACLGLVGLIHGVSGMNEIALEEDASLAMLERSGA